MKYFLIALIAIALGFGAAKAVSILNKPVEEPVMEQESEQAPPTTIEEEPASVAPKTIDNERITVSFTGFGNNSATYEGSFQGLQSNLMLLGGVVAGTITIDANTLTTAVPAATASWKSKASFDVAKYPTATFSFTSWKQENEAAITASGKLTARGITKQITFPVTYQDGVYAAQFMVKASDFGFTNKLVSNIQFKISVPTK